MPWSETALTKFGQACLAARRGALGPALELLDRRGAKRVGGDHQDGTTGAALERGQLADGRGLPTPVHADHEDDPGRAHPGGFLDRLGQRRAERPAHDLAQAVRVLAAGALAHGTEHLLGQRGSEIGGQQRGLEIVQQLLVDLSGAEHAAQ